MKRPWIKYGDPKTWVEDKPAFGKTRHDTPQYHTVRWRKLRHHILKINPHTRKAGVLCEYCRKKGIYRMADMLDHKVSMADGGDFWDVDNLQPLCNSCHRIKTNKEIGKHMRTNSHG